MNKYTAMLNRCKQDILFTRHEHGVKLFFLEKKHLKNISDSFYAKYSLSELMNKTFNFYLNDHESRILAMNDETVKNMGFYSLSDGIGKTMYDISPSENAFHVIKTDREVIKNKTQKIVDDVVIRKDSPEIEQSYLSIKMPFYDDTNQLRGTFGCSVNLNQHSPAYFLSFILNSGLLNSVTNQSLEHEINHHSLTKMQKACASLISKGYTAKAIGKHLNISSRTVETHISNMKDKLGCRNKTDLILKLNHG